MHRPLKTPWAAPWQTKSKDWKQLSSIEPLENNASSTPNQSPIAHPRTVAMASETVSSLPPDLFDQTTIISLLATVAIVVAAYGTSRIALAPATSTTLRFLFIWHLADALCHFLLEGSFLYHCFFSYVSTSSASAPDDLLKLFPTPFNYLGYEDRVYGPQAGGSNPFAQLWMVYARADKRWAGADLGVISLELLTVFFDGPLAVYICYCIAKKDPKASIWMIVLATCELYGGMLH